MWELRLPAVDIKHTYYTHPTNSFSLFRVSCTFDGQCREFVTSRRDFAFIAALMFANDAYCADFECSAPNPINIAIWVHDEIEYTTLERAEATARLEVKKHQQFTYEEAMQMVLDRMTLDTPFQHRAALEDAGLKMDYSSPTPKGDMLVFDVNQAYEIERTHYTGIITALVLAGFAVVALIVLKYLV